jgi:hypothetical protein
MSLEKPSVHEKHEKHEQIQMYATINRFPDWWLPNMSNQLFYFVCFVFFVDKKRF